MEQTSPSKDPNTIRTMFARIARRYDLNNRLHSMWRDQAWRRAAAKMAQLQPGEDALDVACGTGDLTAMLAREKAGGRVVGADFCPEMLDLARKKFPHLPIEWVTADAHSLPFADASFDVVTIAFGLRNLADPRRALAGFARLLRPGGRLVVLEFTPAPRGWGGRTIAWFTRHVMPRTASAIAGEGGEAYDYLHKSVQSFLTAGQLAQALTAAGLADVRKRELTFGTVALCRGVKRRQ
jgi:demethylmenaquinone methyltransferase/2-methoxy-6-polyprenyl-1,4-benzoquinol methylase